MNHMVAAENDLSRKSAVLGDDLERMSKPEQDFLAAKQSHERAAEFQKY